MLYSKYFAVDEIMSYGTLNAVVKIMQQVW